MANETGTLTEFGGNVGATTVRTDFPNGTFIESQGGDRESFIDEWGEIAWRPIAGTPVDGFPSQWHRDQHIRDLKRELAGVEHRLEHLDDPVLAFQEPPTAESLERNRTSLVNTRTAILAELERLDAATMETAKPEPKPRRSAKTTT
jgi:hypothetical protein